ncbi:MAG: hypothetical protein Kow00109_12300 [Acidobacteriota bacterium]
MTVLVDVKVRCSLCGTENSTAAVLSTLVDGYPDLDTRAPEMERSLLRYSVQRCSGCGYCASDLRKRRLGVEAVVHSAKYRRQLDDDGHPELANSFLCKALIDYRMGRYAAATWDLIHAAWACDDEGWERAAQRCRSKAVRMLRKALAERQWRDRRHGPAAVLLVDLLRRARRFAAAERALAEAREELQNELGFWRDPAVCRGRWKEADRRGREISDVLRILAFEELLIERRDASCHTVDEVFGEAVDEGSSRAP